MATKKRPQSAPMISVNGPSPESVEAVRDAVMTILEARADQKTIRLALEAVHKALSAPMTIQNCTFTNRDA